MSEVLLIGVGHPDRGDDAVGPAIVRAIHCPPGVRALEAGGDLLALLDRWAGARAAVVVDAMRGGGPPGRIVRFTSFDGIAPAAFVSSHALDLASVIALAERLGALPGELVVYGIEGARFGAGEPLTAEVTAAVPRAVAQIADELARVTANVRASSRAGTRRSRRRDR